MAAALGEANAPPVAAPEEEETPRFCVGELVEVKPRTFPGMNKPGGTATIRKVHDERVKDGGPMKDGSVKRTTGFTYAVKYVLNGTEKGVDAQWISAKVEVSREEARDGGARPRSARPARGRAQAAEEAERRATSRPARGERLRTAGARGPPPPAEAARRAPASVAEAGARRAAAARRRGARDVKWMARVLAAAPRSRRTG